MEFEARYEPTRFVLPEVPVEATTEYQRLTYIADREAHTLTQPSLFGIVRDAYVTGTYATSDVRFRGQIGLENTRPRLELQTAYPGGHDRWSLGVQATIQLNANLRDVPELREDVELATEDRRAHVERFPDEMDSARADVAYAEEGVDLDELGLDFARQVANAAQAAFDDARDALLAAVEDADRDALEAAVNRATTGLDRAEAGLLGARNSLYNSWRSYVAIVGTYLNLVEAEWEVAQ